MGTTDLGPCACCAPPPDYSNCDDCLDAITGVVGTLSNLGDCTIGDKVYTWSVLNMSYAMNTLIASGVGFKTFELLLASTAPDCGDRGIKIAEIGSSFFGPYWEYVWRATCQVSCSGITMSYEMGLDTWRYDTTGGGCVSVGGATISSPGLGTDVAVFWESVCEEGVPAENDPIGQTDPCGNQMHFAFTNAH